MITLSADVGGTFTDFLLMGPGGRKAALKELSTPADPSLAVMSGLGALANGEAMPLARFLDGVECIVHGTTVTTNAVLTGNTARENYNFFIEASGVIPEGPETPDSGPGRELPVGGPPRGSAPRPAVSPAAAFTTTRRRRMSSICASLL